MTTILPFVFGTAKGGVSGDQPKMPALFVGHGTPMNAIEDNVFSKEWKRLGREIPRPKVVLCISAHWFIQGTYVTHVSHPKTIHDFGGFPPELFAVQYPAPGSPELAVQIHEASEAPKVQLDQNWGLDHGTWSILKHMYPDADIPVLQLSIDNQMPAQFHYDLGKRLAALRRQGVLIIGSGNMVHNLRMLEFKRINEVGYGFDWALEMNEFCKRQILNGDHQPLIDYEKFGKPALLAVPTPEHFYPMLYTLGLQEKGEAVTLFNDAAVGGAATMTSIKIG